jgi:hypothetical protein
MLAPNDIFSVNRNTKELQPGGARAPTPRDIEMIEEPEYESEEDQFEDVPEDLLDLEDLENDMPEVQPHIPLLEQLIDISLPRASRNRHAPERPAAEGYNAYLSVADINDCIKELGLNRRTRRYLAKQLRDFPHDTISSFLSSIETEDTTHLPNSPEPASYKEAMKTPEAKQWREACETEFNSLNENYT